MTNVRVGGWDEKTGWNIEETVCDLDTSEGETQAKALFLELSKRYYPVCYFRVYSAESDSRI